MIISRRYNTAEEVPISGRYQLSDCRKQKSCQGSALFIKEAEAAVLSRARSAGIC
jgi:hypothetical protein